MHVLHAYFLLSLLIMGLTTWYVWSIHKQFYPTMLFISMSSSLRYVTNKI